MADTIQKITDRAVSHTVAKASLMNNVIDTVNQMIDKKYVTLEEAKIEAAKKVDKTDLVTVNNQTLINKGVNIDTTPLRMSDDDINEIFNSLQ